MEFALLTIRLVVGLVFCAHGAQKLFGAFGGDGIAGTADFFESLGIRPSRLQAWMAGSIELAGGALIAIGLATPFAAAALIAVMTTATVTVHLRNGFFITQGGYEYDLVLAATFFALAGTGPGAWSLDEVLATELSGTIPAVAALAAGLIGGVGVAGMPSGLGRTGETAGA